MSLTAENVRAQLQECSELSPLKHVEVEDISGGCGSKMKDIHALKLKCLTPEKFTQS